MEGQEPRILLTGATGTIGGLLLERLEEKGLAVRCLARHPEMLLRRTGDRTEVVAGDLLFPQSLPPAMQGIRTAYYLVHSMDAERSFEEKDREAAKNFSEAAKNASVERIIYLGGLGDDRQKLSPHLRSRHEVGDILRASGIEVIEFRASVVLGSGSLSYEMIRALMERLPVMVTPRWVSVLTQPIGIKDLLAYLLAADELPKGPSQIFEIGGPDKVSYGDLMKEYARQRGLTRVLIPVPILTPYLSSIWLGLFTPLYARVGRKLIESMRYPTLVKDNRASKVFSIQPEGFKEAIAHAIQNEEHETPAVPWGGKNLPSGKRLVETGSITVNVPPEKAFAPIRRIGGRTGWYYAQWLWELRGVLDILAGGHGMRRGRKDPEHLNVGDVVDCWRVERFEPDRRLRLLAEMRLPGKAWLEFKVEGNEKGSTITYVALFNPKGVRGRLYWYVLVPFHLFLFRGMIRAIAERTRN